MYFLHSHGAEQVEGWAPVPLIVSTPEGAAALTFPSKPLAKLYLKACDVKQGWSPISGKELLEFNPEIEPKIHLRLHLTDETVIEELVEDREVFPYHDYLINKDVWSETRQKL